MSIDVSAMIAGCCWWRWEVWMQEVVFSRGSRGYEIAEKRKAAPVDDAESGSPTGSSVARRREGFTIYYTILYSLCYALSVAET